MSTKQLSLTTALTTAEVEARDTAVEPLPFAIDEMHREDYYNVGDLLTLTSKDGDKFIGHLSDVDGDHLRIYVELD